MPKSKPNNSKSTVQAEQAQFAIQRIYIKDSSYEAPNVPGIFQKDWQPELKLDINTQANTLETGVYEVILTITATVTTAKTVAFLVEVKQAGIFSITGADKEQLGHLLGSFCPNILFPYAREAITSQVVNGSFPQLVLAPINFDALYMQQMAEQQGEAARELQ
jgi:preprotein translocase subunit SecB